MVNFILCFLGWHTLDRKEEDGYIDGIGRKQAHCKFCYSHLPLFGDREKKIIFGLERQKNFITVLGKRMRYDR